MKDKLIDFGNTFTVARNCFASQFLTRLQELNIPQIGQIVSIPKLYLQDRELSSDDTIQAGSKVQIIIENDSEDEDKQIVFSVANGEYITLQGKLNVTNHPQFKTLQQYIDHIKSRNMTICIDTLFFNQTDFDGEALVASNFRDSPLN